MLSEREINLLPKSLKEMLTEEDIKNYDRVSSWEHAGLRYPKEKVHKLYFNNSKLGKIIVFSHDKKLVPKISSDGSSSPTFKLECFIATAVYGDVNAPEVQVLREFRDNVLAESGLGRKVIDLYYGGKGELVADILKEKVPGTIPYIKKGLNFLVKMYSD